jgi:hypothetical protein
MIGFLMRWRWPIRTLIRIPRKNGEEWFFDRARRMTDKETRKDYYRLRKMKTNAKAVLFKNMVRTNDGLYTELYSPSPNEFYPIQSDARNLTPMNEDQKMFWADEVYRSHLRWQKRSFWEKYGQIILPITLIGLFTFSLVLVMYGANEYMLPALERYGAKIDQIVRTLSEGAAQLQAAKPPG